ncbi:5-oxoprolinase subunit C family protein [Tautonia plasticadhaerens]|uniref:KipI antagonist n=1 Tax=Tautonia plasticadhaerens TaxID=2527974 RepID=A0A518HBA0_9BACT|nr:biotin-dependent carboxyltransferase family protein [Tautonia plasticadhaerens]QDV37996.1 KipI antagonist [Tautonia plasticadhaerens]
MRSAVDVAVDDGEAIGALTVLRAGVGGRVQDLGRPGHRHRGVPEGGAFDLPSHALANAMVGNGPEAASLELTLFGGSFRAEVPLAVALAGAPMPATRRGTDGSPRRFSPPIAFGMRAGDVLELGGAASGVRTYLAVRGGWRSPVVLGSRSEERPIRPGDVLPAVPGWSPVRWPGPDVIDPVDDEAPIRVVDGPDAGLLDDRRWHRHAFEVLPESDRMGLRLDGPEVGVSALADRLSVPVSPGAVQVSGGRPIVLGVACGTMGGYPYVAHVVSVDLRRLAQARPGRPIRFRPISLEHARRLDRADRLRRSRSRLRVASLSRDVPGGLPGPGSGNSALPGRGGSVS